MAPEFLQDGLTTLKADIYSLGVLITEILTGQKMHFIVQHNVRTVKIRDYITDVLYPV
jgi:serine/threonine protein kinase